MKKMRKFKTIQAATLGLITAGVGVVAVGNLTSCGGDNFVTKGSKTFENIPNVDDHAGGILTYEPFTTWMKNTKVDFKGNVPTGGKDDPLWTDAIWDNIIDRPIILAHTLATYGSIFLEKTYSDEGQTLKIELEWEGNTAVAKIYTPNETLPYVELKISLHREDKTASFTLLGAGKSSVYYFYWNNDNPDVVGSNYSISPYRERQYKFFNDGYKSQDIPVLTYLHFSDGYSGEYEFMTFDFADFEGIEYLSDIRDIVTKYGYTIENYQGISPTTKFEDFLKDQIIKNNDCPNDTEFKFSGWNSLKNRCTLSAENYINDIMVDFEYPHIDVPSNLNIGEFDHKPDVSEIVSALWPILEDVSGNTNKIPPANGAWCSIVSQDNEKAMVRILGVETSNESNEFEVTYTINQPN